jgi:phytoene dehydrogenase-like protein
MRHQLDSEKWDVVIIGGGLAGLTAATYLARAGKRTLVLERADRLGGRAITANRDGCLFNLGPHALFKRGAGVRVLRELGIAFHGSVPDANGTMFVDAIHRYRRPGSAASLFTSDLLSWQEKLEFGRLMTKILTTDTASIMHVSLQEWADARIKRDKMKQLFYVLVRVASYSNQPELVSAGAMIRQLKTSLGGVIYLDRGWQTLVDGLADKALKAGAVIRLRQNVKEISGCTPDLTVTLADESVITTRYVLSTISPAITCNILKNPEKTRLAELKDKLIPVYGASLDVALRRLPDPRTSFALHFEKPLYYSNHSRAAKLTQDKDHAVIHVFRYLQSPEEQTPDTTREELESFLDQLQPGWRQEVITSRFLPRLLVTNGLATAERGVTLLEETPQVPEIPGLYVVGDWLVNEGMLADAALASAKEAARGILEADAEMGERIDGYGAVV